MEVKNFTRSMTQLKSTLKPNVITSSHQPQ
jgi:hypothetical protein